MKSQKSDGHKLYKSVEDSQPYSEDKFNTQADDAMMITQKATVLDMINSKPKMRRMRQTSEGTPISNTRSNNRSPMASSDRLDSALSLNRPKIDSVRTNMQQ